MNDILNEHARSNSKIEHPTLDPNEVMGRLIRAFKLRRAAFEKSQESGTGLSTSDTRSRSNQKNDSGGSE